ncbi:bleomycin resistance protein [Methylobacterium sp. E-045]|uniref:bleomycin resistance protein n=1 Tax=Methylobacterium sp. E-045 TaxID=2836575 RepID=UPI001FB9D99B|nr:VOC family protein [Methylobacterium sp. E-045]MCJ2129670.1 VOC family protein [Methylobacterium sp. E-045]
MTGDGLPAGGFNPLVPELDVRDLPASLAFWCGTLGFSVAYARPENGFAYLERGGAQVMLNVVNGNWRTGDLEPPLGRGINLQITIDAVDPILAALDAASWPLFRPAHEAWCRVGEEEEGLRQFLVQDPNGYLLRFAESLGRRRLSPDGRA